MKKSIIVLMTAWLLAAAGVMADTGEYRALGYQYLSPLPRAEYTSTQTKLVLVRFKEIAPSVVTNLSEFIQVTGASSGNHAGTTKIASDNRTVIFQMTQTFQSNELVTVKLAPQTPTGAVQPYQYQFMVSDHMPDPPIITTRGESLPNYGKENVFDGDSATKWLDLIVPNGTTNFSWIQYGYPVGETHYVNQYSITSAADAPERDPKDWKFYGVDAAGALTLLDTQTNQTFANRLQTRSYSITSLTAYRGYRLEIRRVANPATASGVQVAEFAFVVPSILREYWAGIPGTAISDLTGNANYPNNPTGSSQLLSFEAPTNWADQYGTRVRGYITAPSTGSYVFWIATDDNGELWLSTNADPANIRKIAYISAWTDPQEWTRESTQKSASISLVAGQKYYIEALQKEEGGGDNLSVGWAKPGQATTAPSEVIPGCVLSTWAGGSSAAAALAPATPAQVLPKQSLSLPVVPAEGANLTGVQAQAASVVASPGKTGIMPNGVSVPSDFPHISITTNNNPSADPIFIDNRSGWYSGTRCYNVIFDNNGSPIWYRRMPDERRDMKVQPNGVLTMLARDKGQYFYSLDTHYEKIEEYWTTNGYSVDEHELYVEADGTYYLIGLNYEVVDLSRYVSGAGTSVGVTENCIQKFTPEGDLIFQWRAWDHLDPAGQAYVVGATNPGDFPHMNAITVDTDGHILLSSRNTSEVTKINSDTGEIIWRLGGTHNQFSFVNDPLNGQTSQHAIRPLGNNHYTLFDNGNGHSPQVSRAVEYELNPTAMTATLVWQYPATPTSSLFSHYMGNCQRLSNGNTLINWVLSGYPKLTEVRPDGTKAFEMNWVGGDEAYRVWRCPWQGVAIRPYLILEAYPDNVTLLFNQFGDTDIATYRIYGGTSPNPTTVLATSTTTMKQLSNLTSGLTYYFRVAAVNHNGVEGAISNEESVVATSFKPGQNMVSNGDFSGGTTSWSTAVTSPAAMTWTITGGYSSCSISNSGTNLADLQLTQTGIPLVFGSKYVLAFDAWSSGQRYIEAKVQNSTASINYSGTKTPSLSATPQRFSKAFTMAAASDFSSMVIFRWGGYGTKPVYIDNVVLFSVPQGDLNQDGKVDLLDLKLMSADWRKVQSGLSTDLNADGKVDFKDFGIMGDNWSASP